MNGFTDGRLLKISSFPLHMTFCFRYKSVHACYPFGPEISTKRLGRKSIETITLRHRKTLCLFKEKSNRELANPSTTHIQ